MKFALILASVFLTAAAHTDERTIACPPADDGQLHTICLADASALHRCTDDGDCHSRQMCSAQGVCEKRPRSCNDAGVNCMDSRTY